MIGDNRVTSTCIYCDKTFVRKETLDEHILKTHPDFIASVSRKVHECTECTFKTISNSQFRRHMVTHSGVTITCIYCNKTFIRKDSLEDHIVKRHPDFIASVSRKVHECTECTFKTISNSQFRRHMVTHSDNVHTCIYCNKTFVRKETLDDHIVRTHPDFIASVSRKVHECTRCTYKTVRTSNLKEHIMANHPDIAGCIYCNKIFVRKRTLDDHIVKRHPDFITSVSRKVHECTKCTYRTVSINHLKEHITVNHPDIVRHCIYCNKTFAGKRSFDAHVIKIHPDLIASVSSKIHECAHCSYKTVMANVLKEHILAKHRYCGYTCMHCSTAFKTDYSLNEHIIKKHPKFIASITRKIHACTKCTFKTVYTSSFQCHLLKHPETAATCVHCNKSFLSKSLLDDHIVKKHPSFICSVTSKIRECTKCSYKTTIAGDLKKHMVQHPDKRRTCSHCNAAFTKQEFLNEHILQIHPQFTASISRKIHKCTTCDFNTTILTEFKRHQLKHTDRNSNICVHCNKSFLNKTLLDDHIVKKHPSFIYSVTSKIRECTKCSYKTTIAGYLKRHMVQHPDGIPTCMHCNTAFKTHDSLNEHIIKKHPKFIASITRKIHACTKCNFKTVYTSSFQCHLLKHPETAAAYNYRTCSHCNAAFTRQEFLNEHILQIHPQFTASITQKLLLCSKCTFKTAISRNFQRHLLEHPETAVNYKFSVCIHCNEPFKSITMLDEHIIKKHPSSIPSITRKIHKCTTCDFSTTIHTEFKRHQLKHTDAYINRNSNICVHCNKSFLSKTLLDDHIVKKHPSFIYSVTSKIRECTKCSYKTTIAGDLKKHMMQHPDLSGGEIFNRCMYCDKTFIHKRTLGEHIIKNHPSYISSVTNKIHECTKCNFKTVDKRTLRRHGCQNVEVTELVLS
nr:unnamed protein product [Callosobruchus analis]